MTLLRQFYILFFCTLLGACSSQFNPQKTYTIEQLHADYALMRKALEEAHPGLYRYTAPDTIKWILDKVYADLNRPMTEREFRSIVNPVFNYVRCGHTDIYPSKEFARYYKKNKPKDFPFSVFYTDNKLRILQSRIKDSTIKVGTEIVTINRKPVVEIINQMRFIVPSDGYNQTFKNSQVNNNFGSYYRYLYGNLDSLYVTLRDSLQQERTLKLLLSKPAKPTKKTATKPTPPATTPLPVVKSPKLDKRRNWRISERDSSIAILDINTFKDNRYHGFYRKTFKAFKQKNIKNLIIDLRSNGGGRSDASINLMSYILDSTYVVYDTISTRIRKPSFEKYYGGKIPRFVSRVFLSKKMLHSEGVMHRGAGRKYSPNRKYRFKGHVYLLTNGGSFSATAIFASMASHYSRRVTTIGRETGGGSYGCNAFISPYVTLVHTHVKVRLPMYKLVLHLPGHDQGRGVIPNFPIDYTFDDVRQNKDLDIEKAYQLIKQKTID